MGEYVAVFLVISILKFDTRMMLCQIVDALLQSGMKHLISYQVPCMAFSSDNIAEWKFDYCIILCPKHSMEISPLPEYSSYRLNQRDQLLTPSCSHETRCNFNSVSCEVYICPMSISSWVSSGWTYSLHWLFLSLPSRDHKRFVIYLSILKYTHLLLQWQCTISVVVHYDALCDTFLYSAFISCGS